MRSTIFAAASLAAVASAQTQHIVTVSAFQFTPPTVTAAANDIVTFVFSGTPGGHSVTQSTFANPCTPVASGFDSGFVIVAADAKAPFEEFNVTVTGTTPIWFYCGQIVPSSHCLMGMVGAINPPATGNTYENFKKAAQALKSLPDQGAGHAAPILGGVNASAAAAPTIGADAAATATAPANSSPIPAPTGGAPGSSGAPAPSSGGANGTAPPASSGGANGTAAPPAQSSKPAAAFANSPLSGLYAMIAAVFLGVAL